MIDNLITWVETSFKVRNKIAKWIVGGVAVLAVISLFVAVRSCYDQSVINEYEDGVQKELIESKITADENASDRRAEDAIRQYENARERKDAIADAKDEPLTESATALGCRRLREQGYSTDNFSECNGR